jgi:16S rRNA (guanine966-N2)-methyltransferase
VFLDPPYHHDLVPRVIARLHEAGRLTPDTLLIAETARDEALPIAFPLLAERSYGAARISVWRES